MNGWISLHRCVLENWIYKDAEYFKIWVTMLLQAAHKEHKQLIGNTIEILQKGQFLFGRIEWGKKLGIKEWKLQRATKLFIDDQMLVEIKKSNKYTVYEIKNFEKYQHQNQQLGILENEQLQESEQQQKQQQSNSKTTAKQQQSNTNNNVNNVNNKYSLEFENFWNNYPNKTGKTGAYKHWKKLIKTYEPEQLIQTAINYTKQCEGKDKQYIKVAYNFFGDGVFESYLEQEQPKPSRELTKEELDYIKKIRG